jgi:tetraacyldisaccharide-1-P 4'-kinase
MTFRDHHRYSAKDLARSKRRCRARRDAVFTTDKDAVRVRVAGDRSFPLYRVPLIVEFDPPTRCSSR